MCHRPGPLQSVLRTAAGVTRENVSQTPVLSSELSSVLGVMGWQDPRARPCGPRAALCCPRISSHRPRASSVELRSGHARHTAVFSLPLAPHGLLGHTLSLTRSPPAFSLLFHFGSFSTTRPPLPDTLRLLAFTVSCPRCPRGRHCHQGGLASALLAAGYGSLGSRRTGAGPYTAAAGMSE